MNDDTATTAASARNPPRATDHTRALMKPGDRTAGNRLEAMLTKLGRSDEVTDFRHQRWKAGDRYVADQLALRWIEQGRTDEALQILREASADERKSAEHDRALLARMLAEHGMADELRSRADDGDGAADRLMDHLVANGELDEAVRRAIDRAGLLDPADFAQYGVTGQDLDEMRTRFAAWRQDLLADSSPE